MIPLRISLKGFMSYRDEQTLLFDGAPLWVLAGPNGAGKSAIFDAVTFALYGQHRGGVQNAQALINHHTDVLAVEFDFLLDGNAYRVRRTVSRSGRSTREAFFLIAAGEGNPPHVKPIAATETKEGFDDWVKHTIGLDSHTFTSSVLLLQGRSEKLLQASPKERYEILAELIDLSPYQRLHQLADAYRKEYESQIKSLGYQLQSMPSVSEEDLTTARSNLDRAEKDWRDTHDKVNSLTTWLEQAKQWERLKRELDGSQTELQKASKLLERANEIKSAITRFQDLERVLPSIKFVFEQRNRLAECSKQAEKLQPEIQKLQNELDHASIKKDEVEDKVERLTSEIDKLQDDSTALANRLAELATTVEKLKELKEAQADLVRLEEELSALSPNLAQLVEQAEKRDDQLVETERVLPLLEQLSQFRLEIAKALDQERTAVAKLENLRTQLQECQKKQKQLSLKVESARSHENVLSHAVTRGQTKYDEACQRRHRFEETATQPTCELCGQPITPKHAQQERKRLNVRVADAEAELKNLENQHREAERHLRNLEIDLTALDEPLDNLRKECDQSDQNREQAQRNAWQYTEQLKRTFNKLPLTYQKCVTTHIPDDHIGWIATTYPMNTDLESLRQEINSRKTQVEHLRKLRMQFERWQRLDAQRQAVNQRLIKIIANVQANVQNVQMDEARQACDEQNILKEKQTKIQAQLERQKKAHKKAKESAIQVNQDVKIWRESLQHYETELKKIQAAQTEIKRNLQSTIEGLPEIWREPTTAIKSDKLKELDAEYERLSSYKDLSSNLEQARQSMDVLEKRIKELDSHINDLPREAKRSADEVRRDLNEAKKQLDQADGERREVHLYCANIEKQRSQRLHLEEKKRNSDRQHHLYSLLSNLLGRDGLQLHLLRLAERVIVDLANETLDGLSRGRIRLELRGSDNKSDPQSNKALDLVVYNYDTGSQPMDVALASGSQRFRIAVSLALAIGRYADRESRRIESVIIDEGFGSLDKNGRDDMIQELNGLKEQLARIILVSHQEEFTGAFVNGYVVELVDGTSRVSLLEQALGSFTS